MNERHAEQTETFIPMVLILRNDLVPDLCQIDETELTGNWNTRCNGNATHDYYMISVPTGVKMSRFTIITCKGKEDSNVLEDVWIEMVDIVHMEPVRDNQYKLCYGIPEIIGDPDVPLKLTGSMKGGSCSVGILLGY